MSKISLTLFVIALTFLIADTHARLAAPCNRCVGFGQLCGASSNGDTCAFPYICRRPFDGGVNFVCINANAPGEACDPDLDDCPYGYRCDSEAKRCEIPDNGGWAGVNDECSEKECVNGLNCVGGKCALDGEDCTSSNHCKYDEYCDISLLNGNTCTKRPQAGDDCTILGPSCSVDSVCYDGKCVKKYSAAAGSDCVSIEHCEAGLKCENTPDDLTAFKCREPEYLIINKYEALWRPCEEKSSRGCQCNAATNAIELPIELTDVHHPACKDRLDNFKKCMVDNECGIATLQGNSCMRKFCRAAYYDLQLCPTGNPTIDAPRVCGAGSLVLAFASVVVALLL